MGALTCIHTLRRFAFREVGRIQIGGVAVHLGVVRFEEVPPSVAIRLNCAFSQQCIDQDGGLRCIGKQREKRYAESVCQSRTQWMWGRGIPMSPLKKHEL